MAAYPSDEELLQLFANLSESYGVEVKTWIDPTSPEGKSKLIRGAIALRNNNGGALIIGFDDTTMAPVKNANPALTDAFGQDTIQSLVSKFSSDPFEVKVRVLEFKGQRHPVLLIPAGFRTPVATKSELVGASGAKLVKLNTVFVRTLSANNTVSSAEARYADWPRIVELCFENREADIGSFLRRHLAGDQIDRLKGFFNLPLVDSQDQHVIQREESARKNPNNGPPPVDNQRPTVIEPEALARQNLDIGYQRYLTALKERDLEVPDVGGFEIGAVVVGTLKELRPNKDFINLIGTSSRQLTGWPFFVSLRGAANQRDRPYQVENGWEQLVVDLDPANMFGGIDFWRIEPTGRLYQFRAFDDDMRAQKKGFEPLTKLDHGLPIWRTGDAIVEALAIARSMVTELGNAEVQMAFRWNRLKGRRLDGWVKESRRWFRPTEPSMTDQVVTSLTIPVDAADAAAFQYIHRALAPLYEAFDGYQMPVRVVEEEVAKLLRGI